MKKIIQFIDILDTKLVDRLIHLERLVKIYSTFMHTWKAAEVTTDGKTVKVKFFNVNRFGYDGFTERMFSIEDIGVKIISYKKKVNKEFINRHTNIRIQRAKDVCKWKKYIENADF